MIANAIAEWLKLRHRWDALIGLAVFGLIPSILIISMRYGKGVTFSGLTTPISLAISTLAMILATLIGPILVAIVAAGSLARERETGELSLVLLQHHRRSAVLLGKYVALCAYATLALLVCLGSGALVGALLFGTEGPGLTSNNMGFHTFEDLLWAGTLGELGLMALIAIVLLLATRFNFGATLVLTFGLLVGMDLASRFEQWQPYLLTHIWNIGNFAITSSHSSLLQAVWILLLYIGGGCGVAVLLFKRRDVLP